MKKYLLLFLPFIVLSCTGDDSNGPDSHVIKYAISNVSGGIDIVYKTKSGINAYVDNMMVFEKKEAPFSAAYASITVETEVGESCTFSIEYNGDVVRSQTAGEDQSVTLTYTIP